MSNRVLIFSHKSVDYGIFMPSFPYHFRYGDKDYNSIEEYQLSTEFKNLSKKDQVNSIIDIYINRFYLNKENLKLLKDTKNRQLYIVNEDPIFGVKWIDNYPVGKNYIGKILMCIRKINSL